jgi:hypothetical protein
VSRATSTPVEGIPLPTPVEKSGGFFHWPSPKATVFWLGLLLTVAVVGSAVGGAFFVEKKIYEADQKAQASVNATATTAVATITSDVRALQKQVEVSIADAKEERKEQREDMKDVKQALADINKSIRKAR